MKTYTINLGQVYLFVLFFLAIKGITYAQLHSSPACGENFTLDWSSAPSATNEFNWLAAGVLSNTFINVDNSGIDFTVTFTGETGTLGVWGGTQTPKVGTSASGSSLENLDLVTNGFSSTGITCTITFSTPIYALSFDLSHVNSNGTNGDMYTITATTTNGDTLFPTFTSSPTPSYTINNSTGVVDANASSTSGTNAIVGVNFLDEDYIESVTFLWQNCSSCSPNVMHGSGLGNFSFCIPQTLDFDGVNDYIDRAAFLGGKSEVTMMSWIKLDAGSDGGEIIGQRNFRLYVDSNKNLKGFVRTDSGLSISTPDLSLATLSDNLWYHVSLKYNGNTGDITLDLNGESIWNYSDVSIIGTTLNNEAEWNSDHDFEIGRNTELNNNYFEGSIYECRVYNKSLTVSQLQRQVNQEIENNLGNVRGTIIPKDIEGLLWSDLELYYKMGVIETGYTPDSSNSNVDGHLNNMRTYQEYTAPLPYVTTSFCSGNWTDSNNWVHGDVWDVSAIPSESAIIQIQGNIQLNTDISTVGLIIDSASTLEVSNDSGVFNSWYLELNGILNLEDDCQLIQTENSDLVTSATGKILRRQEGASNVYRYNYWSSPVGAVGATSLTDNNAAINNANNTPFSLNTIKDESGIAMSFTSAYDEAGKISTYWLYTFKNGLTYWDWAALSPSTPLEVGVGYTQKGTGNAGVEQQYIFEGKPNNGTILVNVTDVGGAGSVASVSKTEYLLGNPYPSALDIHKFIDDNVGVIDGTLQLWQQWAGDSHYLDEYQAGYAQVNKLGSVRAYQFVGFYGAHNGSQDGTKTPSRYLPVGQGFITEIIADGTVEFNNSQRVFIKESDADGTYSTGSTFFKSSDTKYKKGSSTAKSGNQTGAMQKIRLEFNATSGPETRRELLMGFSETTTDGFDYGYDAECNESNNNDLNLNLESKNMNIQAYGPITVNKVVPLNFKSSGNNSFEIRITETENLDENQKVYLRDHLTGGYFELTTNEVYSFSSEQGKFNNRFEIVFQNESKTLSLEEAAFTENYIYYQNKTNTLFAKKLNSGVKKMALISMRGETVLEVDNISTEILENGFKFSNISTGAYVVCLRTEANEVLTKKIVFN
ncbi:LamG domain-containing protein [Flavivirga algicola]|uniref:LamG domain-containing protein n=1 Tax=Flavivirga algicola TaxID=2729136 RepID=A0ABX1RWN2_9FLAO|nr:LamG domain-containing protein [Flavivirga algicola]NMH87443.1 LamG domain-containing protein [Flavivirga algicola]